MAELTNSYWVFTFGGICVAFVQSVLTIYIIHKYTIRASIWKKLEFQLILLRVVFDAFNGLLSFTYFTTSIPTLLYSEVVPFDVSFLIGLMGSNFLEMRSFLAAVIAIERVLATTIPVQFYRYRNRVSNWPIILLIVSTGVSCDVVLVGVCGLRLPLTPGCTNFACATPACYQSYASASKVVYSSTNAVFSAILCYRLLMLSWKRAQSPADLRKANWLSLTDGLSTLSFDLLPSLLTDYHIIDIKGRGPVQGVLRQTGRAVEAAVMVRLMKRDRVVTNVRLSVSGRHIL